MPGGRDERERNEAAVHEHLRQIAAVRLVLGLGEDDLRRADDGAVRVLRRQHDDLAALHVRRQAAPERVGLGSRHRQQEADRRAALHAVDQHVAELRRKLENGSPEPKHILTVRKIGYRLQL